MPEPAVVEQAKGVLMLRYGIGSYEALAVLGGWARASDYPLIDVARALTHGVCQGRWNSTVSETWLVRWLEQRLRDDVPGLSTSEAG